ncbi:hypothetical protein D3C80_2177730 [compost metagenome]
MGEWYETMQWGIDGSGTRIEVEGTMRKKADHAVFIVNAFVNPFQRIELVLIKRGKAIKLDRADVAA